MRRWLTILFNAVTVAMVATVFGVLSGAGSTSAAPAKRSMLTIFPRAGSPHDSGVTPHGPGLVLMGGGGDVDDAFVWMHDVIAGSRNGNGGDIIILTASGNDDYPPYLMKLARFNSVQTIRVPRDATTQDLVEAAGYVRRAQGVFFGGGDQANYVWWKGSPLAIAVQHVYDTGGVVGGNSAGLAIQGEWIYDSVAADAANDAEVTTKNAVPDPSSSIISFTHNLFDWPALRGVITDTHFVQRDRLGRLAVFLARLQQQHGAKDIMGVGVDASTAVVVDRDGIGTLMTKGGRGSALFLRGGTPTPIVPKKPLLYRGIQVTLLDKEGQTFDFTSRCAQASTYVIEVNGANTPFYDPSNPYKAPADATVPMCSTGMKRGKP